MSQLISLYARKNQINHILDMKPLFIEEEDQLLAELDHVCNQIENLEEKEYLNSLTPFKAQQFENFTRMFLIALTGVICLISASAALTAPLWVPEGANHETIMGGLSLMGLASLGLNIIACQKGA